MAAALGIGCQRAPEPGQVADATNAAAADASLVTIDASLLADAMQGGPSDALAETIADAVSDVRPDAKGPPLSGPDFAPVGPVYGAPPIAGPRSSQDYEPVIRANRTAMRRCTEKVDGGTHGRVQITLEIDASGAVTKATAGPTELAPEAIACILTIARGMRFPPGNETSKIAFPLAFVEQ